MDTELINGMNEENTSVSVRRAIQEDVPWLMSELKKFSDSLHSKYPLYENDSQANEVISRMVEEDLFLVAEKENKSFGMTNRVGFVAGVLVPHFLNENITILTEVFWWVCHDDRMSRAATKLLEAFTEWGEENADRIIFSLQQTTPVNESSLIKRGFVLQEKGYLLEV